MSHWPLRELGIENISFIIWLDWKISLEKSWVSNPRVMAVECAIWVMLGSHICDLASCTQLGHFNCVKCTLCEAKLTDSNYGSCKSCTIPDWGATFKVATLTFYIEILTLFYLFCRIYFIMQNYLKIPVYGDIFMRMKWRFWFCFQNICF